MAKGKIGKHNLEHIRVYSRPNAPSLYGKLGFWIKAKNLIEVDQALQKLCRAYPDQSLSSLICDAVIYYARKRGKQSSSKEQS